MTTGVKKLLFSFLACILVLVCIDRGIGLITNYCIKHVKKGLVYEHDYMFFKAKPAIAIFGSSRAKHHYVTPVIQQQYGVKTLNYGFDGTSIFLYYLLAKTLIKYNAPKLIILDIKPDEFNEKPDAHWLETFYPEIDKLDVNPEDLNVISPFEKYKLMSYTYRVNNQLIEMLQSIKGPAADTALIDGYAGLTTQEPLPDATVHNDKYNEASAEYLVKIITLCRQHNIKIVVCTSPHYFKFNRSGTIEETAKICRQYNVQYFNYINNAIIPFYSKDFSDIMHLNTAGAEKFTKDLLARIK